VKFIGKSLLLAFMGTGLVFFFLMMGAIPILAVLSRMSSNIAASSVVVQPGLVMRNYGLPLAALAFVVCFGFAFHRFRSQERSPSRH
jgi:hypothetical protein